MTLSVMAMTLHPGPTCLATVPSEGANQDIQYLTMSTSAPQARIALAALNQLNGLMVLSTASASTGTAGSPSVTCWVFPGKRILGY